VVYGPGGANVYDFAKKQWLSSILINGCCGHSGFIIAGLTQSYGSNGDIYLIKTDFNGTEEWQKIYGEKYFDYAESIQKTNDGDIVVAGYSSKGLYQDDGGDVWLLKFREK
jgi:hypothetical protein